MLLTREFFTPSLFFWLLPFFVADFLEAVFLADVFFAVDFFAVDRRVVLFLAAVFFVAPFFAAVLRAALFFAEAFFVAPFLAVAFFFVAVAIAFLISAASGVPKTVLFRNQGKIISLLTQKKKNAENLENGLISNTPATTHCSGLCR